MEATDWIAIYAGFVSSGALALEVRRWFESGPRLRLTVMSQAKAFGYGERDDTEYVFVSVSNRGDRPTTIPHMVFFRFRTRFHRWLMKPSFSAIVKAPGGLTGRDVPHLLQPGESWSGMATYDEQLEELVATGEFYVGVSTNHRSRPIVIPVQKRKPAA